MSPILDSIGSVKGYGWGAFVASGNFESIATYSLTSPQNNIVFNSIPNTYAHLQVRFLVRSNVANNSTTGVKVQINNFTGSSYSSHRIYGSGSGGIEANGSTAATPANNLGIGSGSGSTAPANMFGVNILDILDYANTNKNKTLRSINGTDLNGEGYILVNSIALLDTSAISSLTFTSNGTQFETNSHFALYGIKAAV